MKTVVLATSNKGKIAEFNELLKDLGLEVKGLDQFPEIGEIPEPGETFLENAIIKAQTVANLTGLVAVADDSGLEVDALGGRPGVYSARYSGEDATPKRIMPCCLKSWTVCLKKTHRRLSVSWWLLLLIYSHPEPWRMEGRMPLS